MSAGRRSPVWRRRLLWPVALGLLWVAGCQMPRTKHEWLTFFFDGVPDPNAPRAQTNLLVEGVGTNRVQVFQPELMTSHEPYQKRECQKCHQSRFSNALVMDRHQLCFSCHQTLLEGARFVHAPALSGDCLLCHNPHRTVAKHLLIQPGHEMCFQCHDRDLLTRTEAHRTIGDQTCQSCHDPHKGGHPFFLKAEAMAASESGS